MSYWDVAEYFLLRGFQFTHETVRDWEERFAPLFVEELRNKRRGDVLDVLLAIQRTLSSKGFQLLSHTSATPPSEHSHCDGSLQIHAQLGRGGLYTFGGGSFAGNTFGGN
jgi:hypothetical protein